MREKQPNFQPYYPLSHDSSSEEVALHSYMQWITFDKYCAEWSLVNTPSKGWLGVQHPEL